MEPILEYIDDVTSKDLLMPPDESSSGGASSMETLPGGTLPEILSPFSAPDPMLAGDQAAPAPSLAPYPTIRSSCASHRTSGATQQTFAHASARGKCTTARTNTQWHRQPGGTF